MRHRPASSPRCEVGPDVSRDTGAQNEKSVVLSTRADPMRPSNADSGLRSRRRSASSAASRSARV
ncbi:MULTISPECIES: hypothetical protein [unclassified Streptomyces]|uniref:hypothetical protein n=1 Tax=unclassified Streptomyces TaxID=2593676 RepID=UPI003D8CDB7F